MDKTITHTNAQYVELCKTCKDEMSAKALFCASCGQKVHSQRLSTKTVIREVFASISNVESGFWYTLKMLIFRPDKYLSDYLNGATKKYTNVFRLIFLLSALSLFLGQSVGLMEPMAKITATGNDSEEMVSLIGAIQNYSMYLTFLMIPFFAIASYWVFRRRKLYYAEHLVLNSIWLSGYTLLGTVTLILVPVIGQDNIGYYAAFSMILFLGYFVYANKKYFKFTWLKTILLSCLHYFIGILLYVIFLMALLGLLGLVMN